MNIEVLREFAGLAVDLNFTKTAQRFYITQSVLSKHIAALEREVGAKLFIRDKRSVILTPVGRQFAEDINGVLFDLDTALKKISMAKQNKTSALSVYYLSGASQSFLNDVYTDFVKANPDVELQLTERDGLILDEALEDEKADIVIGMQFMETNGIRYDWQVIYDDYYGIVVSREDELASRSSLDVPDLIDKTIFIANRVKYRYEYDYITCSLIAAGDGADFTFHDGINNMADFNVIPYVFPGCVAVCPSHIRPRLDENKVKFIPLKNPYLKIDISAIWCKTNMNPLVSIFIESLRNVTDKKSVDQLRGLF